MGKIIKRIVGSLILAHIMPALFMFYESVEIHGDYSMAIPYVAGWCVNILAIALVYVVKLVWWCFDD